MRLGLFILITFSILEIGCLNSKINILSKNIGVKNISGVKKIEYKEKLVNINYTNPKECFSRVEFINLEYLNLFINQFNLIDCNNLKNTFSESKYKVSLYDSTNICELNFSTEKPNWFNNYHICKKLLVGLYIEDRKIITNNVDDSYNGRVFMYIDINNLTVYIFIETFRR